MRPMTMAVLVFAAGAVAFGALLASIVGSATADPRTIGLATAACMIAGGATAAIIRSQPRINAPEAYERGWMDQRRDIYGQQ